MTALVVASRLGSFTMGSVAGLILAGCGTSEPIAGSSDSGYDQVDKLTVDDLTGSSTDFGNAIAASGDIAVIGARQDTTNAGGPLGSFNFDGSAYVFRRHQGQWTRVRKLIPSDAPPTLEPEASETAGFGNTVAASGDTIVVGANFRNGTNEGEGAAYVFERNAGGPDNWGEAQKLVSPNSMFYGEFGWAVDIAGDTIVVGQPTKAGNCGCAVYVYVRNAETGTWEYVQALQPDPDDISFFGWSVDLLDNELLIGGAGYQGRPGSAYLFRRETSSGVWSKAARLVPNNASPDYIFGHLAFLDGDTAIVGGPFQTADSGNGAVHVFSRNQGGPGNWGQVARIVYPGAEVDSDFGRSAALRGDQILVGAPASDTAATNAGDVYLFERNVGGDNSWGLAGQLARTDAQAGDRFSGLDTVGAIVFADSHLLIGAPGNSDTGPGHGAVYVFDTPRLQTTLQAAR